MRKFAITPIGGLYIIAIMILISNGLSNISDNITSRDTKQILTSLNDTASTNSLILQSGNRTNVVLAELKEFQEFINERDENQTAELLPIFLNSFNQTDRVSNQTDRIENLMQQVVEQLAQQRFTEKEIRDNMVQLTFDVDRLVNVTERLANQSL